MASERRGVASFVSALVMHPNTVGETNCSWLFVMAGRRKAEGLSWTATPCQCLTPSGIRMTSSVFIS